jgi:hypothetical protein
MAKRKPSKPFRVWIPALNEMREATFEEMRADVIAQLDPGMRLMQHLHNNRLPVTRGQLYELMAIFGRVMNYFEKLEGDGPRQKELPAPQVIEGEVISSEPAYLVDKSDWRGQT